MHGSTVTYRTHRSNPAATGSPPCVWRSASMASNSACLVPCDGYDEDEEEV
jgi:hypothetical protein